MDFSCGFQSKRLTGIRSMHFRAETDSASSSLRNAVPRVFEPFMGISFLPVHVLERGVQLLPGALARLVGKPVGDLQLPCRKLRAHSGDELRHGGGVSV